MERLQKLRIDDIPEATKVLVELGERRGDVENIMRASNYVVGGLEAFLKSIARRAKYDFFIYEIISKDHVGFLPKEIVYEGATIGYDTSYRIVATKPEGEVQITSKTILRCKLIDLK
jgi:hypothetical protein